MKFSFYRLSSGYYVHVIQFFPNKKLSLFGSIFFILMLILVPAYKVFAVGPVSFTHDTPIVVGSITLTATAGSTAISISVGTSTLTVTTGADDTFVVLSADRYDLTTSPQSDFSCGATSSRVLVTGVRTIVITPTATVCVPPTGSGGGPFYSVPAFTTQATTPAQETIQPEEGLSSEELKKVLKDLKIAQKKELTTLKRQQKKELKALKKEHRKALKGLSAQERNTLKRKQAQELKMLKKEQNATLKALSVQQKKALKVLQDRISEAQNN